MKKLLLSLGLFAVVFVTVLSQMHAQSSFLQRLCLTLYQRTVTAFNQYKMGTQAPFTDKIINIVPAEELFETQLKNYIPAHKHHIVVVIPSYNNAQWYERNLASVFGQDYDNFSVVYTDDASPDGTGELVRKCLHSRSFTPAGRPSTSSGGAGVEEWVKNETQLRVKLIVNKTNQGACANLYTMIDTLPPDSIVITLDGDDWLATPSVLSLINKVYNKYDVLLTYGTYQRYPYTGKPSEYCKVLPAHVIEQNGFRAYPWVTSQLRTFKASLFQRIQKEDLCYQGAFLKMTYDLGIMFPMLEMAGKRSLFIPDVLYIYNYATPINDAKVNYHLQNQLARYIRAKEKYQLLS
ncbi:glycosyltransferase family 2 protein [Candidatus Dependentiae bacterium]|nr:glycosyltransferase family 2 protein [Candidatus Dependentiae bacterium]